MTRRGRHYLPALMLATLGLSGQAFGQGDCMNEPLYPAGAVTPLIGEVTTISTCSFEEEHSHVTGILAGQDYEITLSSGGYITVREGTYDGAVVAQGYASVQVLAASGSDLFPHWNVNDTCATMNDCVTTTIELLLDCTQPEATFSMTEDCDAGTFSIVLDISSTGDGSVVAVSTTVDGSTETIPDLGPGQVILGPFPLGTEPSVVVEHETDPLCNLDLGTINFFTSCPFNLVCGGDPVTTSYCYGNNEVLSWNYLGDGGGSLMLTWLAGTIESCCDNLMIYDGTDATGTLLYEYENNVDPVDLTGITVYAFSGAIHVAMTSDVSVSCQSGSTTEWEWEVRCLGCTLPAATVTMQEDCDLQEFSLLVDVTSTGDGATADLVVTVDGGASTTLPGLGIGPVLVGPYPLGTSVQLDMQHESNVDCNYVLGTFTDSGDCPYQITCGGPALTQTYCYDNNANTDWLYTAFGTGTMRLRFNTGSIQSFGETLTIYDGVDITGPVLYQFQAGDPGDLSDVEVFGATGGLYMVFTADGFGSCGSGAATEWEWEVTCLTCELPVATYTINDDCANQQFSITVDITDLGDGAFVDVDYIVNGGTLETVAGQGVGQVVLGPFALNDTVSVVVGHEDDSECDVDLGLLTDTGTCPDLIDCGTNYPYTFCHGENEDARYYYAGTGTFPIAVFFNAGSLETCCDELHVYDGPDVTAPELTPPGGLTGDLTGVFFASTNPEHRLTIQITTDGSVSCQSGSNLELDWTVSCLDCVPPTADFTVEQDCEDTQYYINVDVTVMGTDAEFEIINDGAAPEVVVNAVGTYQVGPFATGATVNVTLVNDANDLCNVYSGPIVNPECPVLVCGSAPVSETYCYLPNDQQAWAYEFPGGGTLRLRFLRGTIESNTFDHLTIYDGNDVTAPVLFDHDTTNAMNLGPAGSAVEGIDWPYSTVDLVATGNNLYMTMSSDGSVQCDSETFDEWAWEVFCDGCAAPGVNYTLEADCRHRTYTAQVNVTTAPVAEGLRIVNSVSEDTLTVNATGTYTFGPYGVDDYSVFQVTSMNNPLCYFISDSLIYTSDSCVIRSCGFDNYEYCYGNDEDRWYTFESLENVPSTIAFLQGQMPAGDRIVVYNGYDETAAVIYQGNNGGNLAGFAVNSQNTSNAITLRIESNGAASCADGQVPVPLRWDVACGAVGIDEAGNGVFAIYPNPTTGLLNIELGSEDFGNVQVRMIDMSGRTVIDKTLNVKGGSVNTIDMTGLMTGQYMLQLITDEWVKTQRVELTR